MSPKDLFDKLSARPFRPFRVYISDGGNYEVLNQHYAFVAKRDLIIGLSPDDSGFPTSMFYIDPQHVTRLELLDDVDHTDPPRQAG